MAVRWARLLPKTAVAHNAATPATEPISAVPTGTARVPRPRSRACRMPMTAPGGAPAAAAAPATADGRVAGARPAAPRTRVARRAGTTPEHQHHGHRRQRARNRARRRRTSSPGAGSASRASPSRGQRRQQRGHRDPAGRAGHRHDQGAQHDPPGELPRAQAQRGQHLVVRALRAGLPGQRGPDYRDGGQRGQPGQHQPADRLRVDRGGDRGRGPVKILHPGPLQAADPGLEPREVGLPVAQPHVVGREGGRALGRGGEARARVQGRS